MHNFLVKLDARVPTEVMNGRHSIRAFRSISALYTIHYAALASVDVLTALESTSGARVY